MRTQTHTVDSKIAVIAGRGHGVITREELLAAGCTRSGINRRLAKGTLHREFPGVYRVGHRAPSIEAHYLAAVKACGPTAVLFGRAAAHLFLLVKGPAPVPEVMTTRQCSIQGIRTRRTRRLDPREVTTLRQIPITTVPRALFDLAALLDEDELALACHEAWVRYRVGPKQIDPVLARHPNGRGAGTLRRVIHGDVHVVLSKLERRFLRLVREAGLRLPVTNRLVDAHIVDCRWPDHALTVELDSYRFHNTRYSWQQGYERERAAHSRGDQFRRYTWADVFEDPSAMLRELRALLIAGEAAA